MQPNDIDEKTGDSVETVLRSKHPDARIPKPESLPQYDNTPDFVEVDITEDTVAKVARRPSGSAGLGGPDSHALKHWLRQLGLASTAVPPPLADVTALLSHG